MLSPSVCRLTLALLVFCWGRSSPIFPCTSLEIGSKSAWLERSWKSPSSLFFALLENGHSPDIFSSFSFAQNMLTAAVNVLAPVPYLMSEGHAPGRAAAVSWRNSIIRMPSSLATRRFKWSAPEARDRIQYSLKTARAQDGRELSLPKANEKLEEKHEQANPYASGSGWAEQPISKKKLFPGDSSHAMHFFLFRSAAGLGPIMWNWSPHK